MTEKSKKEAVKQEFTIEQRLAWIQFDLHAPKGKMNEFGGFKYRSLMDIFQALKPLLKLHGGFVRCTDEVVMIGDRYYIKAAAAYHYNEQSIQTFGYAREPDHKTKMDDAQVTGTSSSYARKYAMDGLFAIDNNKDIDSMKPEDHKPAGKKAAAGKGKTAPVKGNPAIDNEAPADEGLLEKAGDGKATTKAEAPKKAPPKKAPPKSGDNGKISDKKFEMIKQARRLAGQVGPEAQAMRGKIAPKAGSCAEMSEKDLQKLLDEMAEHIRISSEPQTEEAPEETGVPEQYDEGSPEDEEMGM